MELSIPSLQLQDIARTYGTPLYVYDAASIEAQYQKMVQAFENLDVKIFYACKALTNVHVLRFIRDLGCNIDCSSSNEVRLAIVSVKLKRWQIRVRL
jgi:diaminopimelate decarboxylase